MAVFRNPILRHTFLPLNRNSGDFDKEVIISNTSTRKIRDLELPSQLNNSTKNTHMFRVRTREDAYRDITLVNPQIIGRMQKSKTQYQKNKYTEPRI